MKKQKNKSVPRSSFYSSRSTIPPDLILSLVRSTLYELIALIYFSLGKNQGQTFLRRKRKHIFFICRYKWPIFPGALKKSQAQHSTRVLAQAFDKRKNKLHLPSGEPVEVLAFEQTGAAASGEQDQQS